MKTKAGQSNRLVRIITTPFRALCKARDYYVNSMLNCANMNAIGVQRTSQYTASLPRSFSAASSRSNNDEDYRELVRAASARTAGTRRPDMDVYVTKMKPGPASGPRALPPRSISVAMGRIDEERPSSYFGEEGNNGILLDEIKYPRSKSHAVGRSTPF